MAFRHKSLQQTKNSSTFDINVSHITLVDNPGDSEQINVLGREMGEPDATMKASKRATKKVFVHLMSDLDVRSSKTLRYSSKCSLDKPFVFYSSTDEQ